MVRRAFLRGRQTQDVHPDPRPAETPHPFDLAHGTDTSGYVPGEALRTGHAADLYNTAYYAISPSTLQAALRMLPIEPGEYTFVDLGCGKGRALLLAAEAGFGRVLGVELAAELAEVAWRNCERNERVGIETGDAAAVRYPAGPLVIFFYHPFLAPLLKRVLRNLLQQRGEFYLLSANPGYTRVLLGFPELVEQWTRAFALSEEDAAHDRHGIDEERYTLWRAGRD